MRPVFVSPANIVASTGAMSTMESRRFSSFSRVTALRSDLRSRANTLTATLDYRPVVSRFGSGVKVPLRVSYTIADLRNEATGFSGTTAGDPRERSWVPGAFSRHAVLLSTGIRVPDWLTLTAGFQLRSGATYTPRVGADINGDGLANDRAFVFDPKLTPDPVLSTGLSRLLSTAPKATRECLMSQMGTLAATNSCVGPVIATLNSSVTVDAARLGLRNRGVVRLAVTNVLAGLDRLLHGASNVRGWGQSAYVDPILLDVRGFDPAEKRFRYAVNPQFGNSSVLRNLFLSPFKITLDFSVDLGPDREQRALNDRFAPRVSDGVVALDSAQIFDRLIRTREGLFDGVLSWRDTLRLNPVQVDSLERMSARHTTTRESTYGALAGYLVSRSGDYEHSEVRRRWREAIETVVLSEWRSASAMQAMLSPDQLARLSKLFVSYRLIRVVDRKEIERELSGWQTFPYD